MTQRMSFGCKAKNSERRSTLPDLCSNRRLKWLVTQCNTSVEHAQDDDFDLCNSVDMKIYEYTDYLRGRKPQERDQQSSNGSKVSLREGTQDGSTAARNSDHSLTMVCTVMREC